MSQNFSLSVSSDCSAILLAGLCTVHCLFLPLIVPLLPWLGLISEHESEVHRWLLFAIVPISAYALVRGTQRHRRLAVIPLGAFALALLIVAPFVEFLTSTWESMLTLIGSAMLSASHVLNLHAIRHAHASIMSAACPDPKA